MEVLDFLKKFEHILSFLAIEKELGIPQSTLHKAVTGVRPLPEKWHPVLKNYLNHIYLEIALIDLK